MTLPALHAQLLSVPDADPIDELKRALGAEIARKIEMLRQWDVAVLLGIDQPGCQTCAAADCGASRWSP